MKHTYTLIALVISLWGCAQQDDNRLRERAELEGKATVQAEQDVLNERVKKMEADLATRHRFYQAINGRYTGHATAPSGLKYKIKLLFVPSLSPLPPTERVRTIEEVTYDLNNLHFNVEAISSDLTEQVSAGCVFSDIRPDIPNGQIVLISSGCSLTYSMDLSIVDVDSGLVLHSSQDISSKVLSGAVSSVKHITGKVTSAITGASSEFHLERL